MNRIGIEEPQLYAAIEELARDLLIRFLAAARTHTLPDFLLKELAPRPGDAARAFLPDVAPRLEAAYAQMWASPPAAGPKPDQNTLLVGSASTRDFQQRSPRSGFFPGGYAKITPHLAPGRMWIRWKFVRGTESTGMAYDGLVWLDDRFSWYPKPWRALELSAAATDLEN